VPQMICGLFLSMLILPVAGASEARAQEDTQQAVLKDLQSPDWHIRYDALERLKSISPNELEPRLRDKLIQLLAAEARRRKDRVDGKITLEEYLPPGASPMAFADYYQSLIDVTTSLHDERALPMLIDYVSQDGTETNDQLAAYGRLILKPVFARLAESRNELVQGAMADILAHVLIKDREHQLTHELSDGDRASIQTALRPLLASSNMSTRFHAAFALALLPDRSEASRVKDIFLDRLSDPSPGARLATLRKVRELEDSSFVPLDKVKELAESDNFQVDLRDPTLRARYLTQYPIRRLASQVLERFSKKRGGKKD